MQSGQDKSKAWSWDGTLPHDPTSSIGTLYVALHFRLKRNREASSPWAITYQPFPRNRKGIHCPGVWMEYLWTMFKVGIGGWSEQVDYQTAKQVLECSTHCWAKTTTRFSLDKVSIFFYFLSFPILVRFWEQCRLVDRNVGPTLTVTEIDHCVVFSVKTITKWSLSSESKWCLQFYLIHICWLA